MTTRNMADEDVATVRSVFGAFASGDLAALAALFHQDATWHHRNDDRLGGRHRGSDGIAAYLAEAAQLTTGTLRPVPRSFMADSAGRVCVLVQVSGTRPDGRSFVHRRERPGAQRRAVRRQPLRHRVLGIAPGPGTP